MKKKKEKRMNEKGEIKKDLEGEMKNLRKKKNKEKIIKKNFKIKKMRKRRRGSWQRDGRNKSFTVQVQLVILSVILPRALLHPSQSFLLPFLNSSFFSFLPPPPPVSQRACNKKNSTQFLNSWVNQVAIPLTLRNSCVFKNKRGDQY